MINNTKNAVIGAKEKLRDMLAINYGEVTCQFRQSGVIINGLIILHTNKEGVDIYERASPDVRVRSSTGKEYHKLITDIISVEGVEFL